MSVAQFIDHTILKPSTTLPDIEKICREAEEWGFAAVCVPPYFVADAKRILTDGRTGIATVIGFPFGYSHYKAKNEEMIQALGEGATELDMVMNIAAFKTNDMAYLETEIALLSRTASDQKAVLKVIIESGILNEQEIIKCCGLYRHYPVNFLKTSTGYAEQGASVEAVSILRRHLPESIQIKASGGIRNYEFARQLLDAGATRLGCSASVAIVKEEQGHGEKVESGGY